MVSIGFVQRASLVALRPSLARSPLCTLELEDDTPARAPSATDAVRSPRQTPPQQLQQYCILFSANSSCRRRWERYVRRNAIRRREYNIFVRVCLYICTVCTYNYVCVRVYLFVCACACFLRANRLSSTRNAVRSVKAHAPLVYIIIICIAETKKREEKNWML